MSWTNTQHIEPPWTFKIEFSKGCNLRCKFCPVYARPDLQAAERRQFMTPELLAPIARQLREVKHDGRVELTMRGEPTLNPDLEENLRILRTEMPSTQIAMFTNGTQIIKDPALMARMIDAGVNILNIDCYNGTYERFEKLATESQQAGFFAVRDFRTFSAYKRHPHGEKIRVVNLVPDIGDTAKLVAVRAIHNNAGNADPEQLEKNWGIKPLQAPLKKGCARPFREMVIGWNGEVLICCHDWGNEVVMGKMPEQTAHAIWYGDIHRDILRSLYKKDRSGAPCNKCDYSGGFRLGFLKDPA